MNVKKIRINQKNTAGEYDTLHPETSSNQVILSGGGTLDAKLTSVDASVTTLTNKVTTVEDDVNNLKTTKTNKDANGIFTTVTYRRKSNNTVYATSVLSGGTSPNYTTRTVTYYQANGTTVRKTVTYALTYDADGSLVSEV